MLISQAQSKEEELVKNKVFDYSPAVRKDFKNWHVFIANRCSFPGKTTLPRISGQLSKMDS